MKYRFSVGSIILPGKWFKEVQLIEVTAFSLLTYRAERTVAAVTFGYPAPDGPRVICVLEMSQEEHCGGTVRAQKPTAKDIP
jgi:hypothetical protein